MAQNAMYGANDVKARANLVVRNLNKEMKRMQSCLFSYNRTTTDAKGTKVVNQNYLNPMNVISAYWDFNEQGQRRLFVFLPGKSLIFGEDIGKSFVIHMENWLRLMLPTAPGAAAPVTVQTQTRRSRPQIEAEYVDADVTAENSEAAFVS